MLTKPNHAVVLLYDVGSCTPIVLRFVYHSFAKSVLLCCEIKKKRATTWLTATPLWFSFVLNLIAAAQLLRSPILP